MQSANVRNAECENAFEKMGDCSLTVLDRTLKLRKIDQMALQDGGLLPYCS
jgi:hypothetical protein